MNQKTNSIDNPSRVSIISVFVLIVCLTSQFSFAQNNNFIDVSETQNIKRENFNGSFFGGVSFVDVDGDGWDDLTYASREGQAIEFYKNNQGTFHKTDLNLEKTCDSKQIIWVDYDNDGDKDLFLTCRINANMLLYENDGQMNFTDVAEEKGLKSILTSLTFAATWTDYNRDGYLDLYVGYYSSFTPNQLFKNIEGNSFEKVSNISNSPPGKRLTFALQAIDLNNDQWEDIYLASDRDTKNELLQNNNGEFFENISESSNTEIAMDGMGITTLDMNNDGYFEMYISNSESGNVLLFNNGDDTFTDISSQSGALFSSFAWGVNTLDIDNDSRSDLYVSGSNQGTQFLSSALYRAIDQDHFEITEYEGMKGDTLVSFSNAVGDFNNDGKMDIAVGNADFYDNQLWQNTSETGNNWLQVKLEGTFSNRDALGGKVILYSGDLVLHQYMYSGTSFLSQNTSYVHFGISNLTEIDSLVIKWPSGLTDVIESPEPNQKLLVTEGESNQPVPLLSSKNLQNTFCEGETVPLNFEVYGRAINTIWSDQSMNDAIIVTASGTYSAIITSGNTAVNTEVLNLTFNPIPEVTSEVTQISGDELGAITVTGASNDYDYKWSHDFSLNTGSVTGLEAGTYSVSIVNPAGCALVESFVIDVVTGIEEALIEEIKYTLEGNELIISIPNALQNKLKGWQVFSSNGTNLFNNETDLKNKSEIHVPQIPKNQMVLVNLLFDNDRIVKKLIFIE